MKSNTQRLIFLAVLLLVVVTFGVLITTAPQHPTAVFKVVDQAGKPIAGATIQPEGLRTKEGPYRSGWYGWVNGLHGVSNPPVITDAAGAAQVSYPRYVFERIETGVLCLAVSHPDYVSERPECVVATAPPAGAPWQVRLSDLWHRLRRKTLIARPDPIVLRKGAILRIAVAPDASIPASAQLFAQVSGEPYGDTNFWHRPEPGVIVTRRLAAGPHTARAIRLDGDRAAWFSEVATITAVTEQTNELVLVLKRGIAIQGQLDDNVPRPVTRGRVVAHVTPAGLQLKDSPPQWQGWAAVSETGRFTISALPEGDLEIVAMCDGFVSTNGPGQFKMRYPQKHSLGPLDLSLTIGMEPTARLEVTVTDENNQPLKDVRVMTWPNVRYGEWGAKILMSDCYNTADWLLAQPDNNRSWDKRNLDFEGVTSSAGVAVLPNLPTEVTELAVEHARYELPVVESGNGTKHRQYPVDLIGGQTNRVKIKLQPREQSAISHY